jgi:hypothetical protein
MESTEMALTPTQVRLVIAGPFEAAVFRAFGESPEGEAFGKLETWATPRSLLEDATGYMLFGQNDPPPESEGGDYGYRYMLTVDDGVGPGSDVETETISRSVYAVTRATLKTIGRRWNELYAWCEDNGHLVGGHGLEEHLVLPSGDSVEFLTFDLWLPVHLPGDRERGSALREWD